MNMLNLISHPLYERNLWQEISNYYDTNLSYLKQEISKKYPSNKIVFGDTKGHLTIYLELSKINPVDGSNKYRTAIIYLKSLGIRCVGWSPVERQKMDTFIVKGIILPLKNIDVRHHIVQGVD
jgi:hypothetical protein